MPERGASSQRQLATEPGCLRFHLGFLIYTTELTPTSQRRRRVQSEQGVVHRDDKAKVGGYCCYF